MDEPKRDPKVAFLRRITHSAVTATEPSAVTTVDKELVRAASNTREFKGKDGPAPSNTPDPTAIPMPKPKQSFPDFTQELSRSGRFASPADWAREVAGKPELLAQLSAPDIIPRFLEFVKAFGGENVTGSK